MPSNKFGVLRVITYGVLPALTMFAVGTAMSQVVAPDFTASPDVYKVVAENAQHRVVEGTWKPGQRDVFHSHPATLFYWTTDCSLRFYLPDGTHRDTVVTPGRAGAQAPVASHSVENTGKAECKIVMFESK